MGWRIRLLVYVLFLVSGATGLVYEIAWTRNLSLIFGASHQAVSIVLGAFMAGLALGAVFFGGRSARTRRPLRLYAWLELGVAACVLLLPLLLRLIDQLYVSAAMQINEVNWTLTTMRIGMAFAALVLPTFFMGGTLPVLTRFLVQHYGEFGVRLSSLYGINTVGAVIGVFTAAFFLLPHYGVWHSQLVAVAANVAIFVIAVWVDRRLEKAPVPAAVPVSNEAPAATTAPAPVDSLALSARGSHVWGLRLAFWGTAVSGGCALALEVLWTRGISISTGTSVYSFAVMLAAFLIGIAAGSWLHALLPLRRVHEAVQFGIVLLIAGVSSALVSQLIPVLPLWAVELHRRVYGLRAEGVAAQTTLLLSFSIMLVPCLCMGIAFPLAGQARARLKESFGKSVGDTVGLNTFGAILGSLAAGFVLIPVLGLQRGMLMMAAIQAIYGALVLVATSAALTGGSRWVARAGAVVALVLGCAIPVVAKPWDIHALGTFNNSGIPSYLGPQGEVRIRDEMAQTSLIYYREGYSSNVSVRESAEGRGVVVSGKVVASDSLADLHIEVCLGHLPVLLHPNPKSAVIVGLGTGITLGGVTAHKALERIVLVEIEPAVFDAADKFADVHDDALHDPRLKICYQDGRNFLLTTPDKFDVITADPIHPWAAGSVYLYTNEYYRTAKSRLNEGGIMAQWLPLYEMADSDLRSVAITFAANFPYTQLWQCSFDVILIGSDRPIQVDLKNLSRRLKEPPVARQLARAGIDDPLCFLADFTLDDAAVRDYARGAPLITDDNLNIEFSGPINRAIGHMNNVQIIDARRVSPRAVVPDFSPLFSSDELTDRTLRAYMAAKSETATAWVITYTGGGGARIPLSDASRRLRQILADLPEYRPAARLFAMAQARLATLQFAAGQVSDAERLCDEALAVCPDDPENHRLKGRCYSAARRYTEAVTEYETALRFSPRHMGAYNELASALAGLGRHAEAIRVLQKALEIYPLHVPTAMNLAWQLATATDAGARNGSEAVRLAEQTLHMPGAPQATVLTTLAAAQAETKQFDLAIRTAQRALDIAERDGQQALVGRLKRCLTAFQSGQPFHQ